MTETKEIEAARHVRATVCLLVRGDEVLLCEKKKAGLGQGYLMGPGGKIEEGETSEGCAIRETVEEINVVPRTLKLAGTIKFNYFHDRISETQEVDFYVVDKWEGGIEGTDEMIPEWFKKNEVPYERLLPANEKFIEPMLRGEFVTGTVTFDEDFNPLSSDLTIKPAELV
ncbi:NUDIX domain-containing protein [Candidatus Curtissbacteria bacterium]|nr:NUDIX domain-containing protein [Candidatus Curtissbacteria bacterium]